MTEIFFLCDSHKFLRAILQVVTLMLRDVYIANIVQNMSVCTIFDPRTAKIEELFFIFSQLLISLQVVYHL